MPKTSNAYFSTNIEHFFEKHTSTVVLKIPLSNDVCFVVK